MKARAVLRLNPSRGFFQPTRRNHAASGTFRSSRCRRLPAAFLRAVATSGSLTFAAVVRADDVLYQGVAHHVPVGELHEGESLDPVE